jgi:hypothetical protein
MGRRDRATTPRLRCPDRCAALRTPSIALPIAETASACRCQREHHLKLLSCLVSHVVGVGSLYVEGGDRIVPLVNDEIVAARAGGATIVLT